MPAAKTKVSVTDPRFERAAGSAHPREAARARGWVRPTVGREVQQITTLRRDRLAARPIGGNVGPGRMVEIEKAILRAIGIPVS